MQIKIRKRQNMKVQELLTEDNWVKGSNARDKNNNSVHPTSDEACKWCLFGAIIRCYIATSEILERIGDKIEENSVTIWNDDPQRTFEDVEALIKELDI